jgi:hypothetical protein
MNRNSEGSMRLSMFVSCSMVLAGCGFEARPDVTDAASTIDAATDASDPDAAIDAAMIDAPLIDAATIDAAAIDAAMIDAAVDAPIDAIVDASIDAMPTAEVVDMGTSAGGPVSLALDAQYVYWSDGTSIYRKALDGTGGRLTITTHTLPSGNSGYGIGEIDVDGTWIYYLANGQQPASGGSQPQLIRRVKDGSGVDEVMVTMPPGVPNQAGSKLWNIFGKDPTYVYMTSAHYHAGGVYRALKSNPQLDGPLPGVSGIGTYLDGYIGHVVVSGSTLFVTRLERALTAEGGIVSCALPACSTRSTVASFAEAGGSAPNLADPWLAVDANNVYWAQYPSGTAIASSSRTGGGVSFLATLPSAGATEVVADDIDNYVRFLMSGANGGIRRVTKGVQGQTPVTLVSNQSSPVGLVMDATHLYWGEAGTHKIWRIAR